MSEAPQSEGRRTRLAEQRKALPDGPGVYLFRDAEGRGITVSYWSSLEALKRWKANKAHEIAQSLGKSRWYKNYKVQICRIEYDYDMAPP